jgi:N-methylhydantoinase B
VIELDGQKKTLPSKITTQVAKGSRYTTITPGGGGWGNPFARLPEKVLRDVIEGLVSIDRAETEYGVVIDRTSMEIDWTKTGNARETK